MALPVPSADAQPTCAAGGLYCAEATSVVQLACGPTDNGTRFRCDVETNHTAAAWSAAPGPGQLLVPSTLEIGVCNGPGPCNQTLYAVGAPCSWNVGTHGCSTVDVRSYTLGGTLDGCLYVWVFQEVDARARAPGVGADLARDVERAFEEYDSCA